MRVLVIGGSGFIGRRLVARLSGSSAHNVSATYRSRPPGPESASWHRVNLTDSDALENLFHLTRPEVVVHLAAMADVGACERNPEQAMAVNARATASIAQLCGVHDARLVFVSSEYVFDGERGYYREDEPPNPITHYGRTKRQAEESVAGFASRWSVVRTSIVYGWRSDGGRNFAPGLIDHLASGRTFEASTGVMRTPVYVEHLVDGIGALTETDRTGIYHIAGSDWVSMYDFAMTVARAFSLDDELVIPRGSTPGSALSDERQPPDRLGLDCKRTFRDLGLPQPGLSEGLAAMRAAQMGN